MLLMSILIRVIYTDSYCFIMSFIFPPTSVLFFFKAHRHGLPRTNEGEGLLVEHSAWQQVEVVLHRVHDHRVTRIVASLQRVQHTNIQTERERQIPPT